MLGILILCLHFSASFPITFKSKDKVRLGFPNFLTCLSPVVDCEVSVVGVHSLLDTAVWVRTALILVVQAFNTSPMSNVN